MMFNQGQTDCAVANIAVKRSALNTDEGTRCMRELMAGRNDWDCRSGRRCHGNAIRSACVYDEYANARRSTMETIGARLVEETKALVLKAHGVFTVRTSPYSPNTTRVTESASKEDARAASNAGDVWVAFKSVA